MLRSGIRPQLLIKVFTKINEGLITFVKVDCIFKRKWDQVLVIAPRIYIFLGLALAAHFLLRIGPLIISAHVHGNFYVRSLRIQIKMLPNTLKLNFLEHIFIQANHLFFHIPDKMTMVRPLILVFVEIISITSVKSLVFSLFFVHLTVLVVENIVLDQLEIDVRSHFFYGESFVFVILHLEEEFVEIL